MASGNMKNKIIILVGVLLIILVLAPRIASYLEEKRFYQNHIVAITSFIEITILDKYIEGDHYYITLSLDNNQFLDKYKIKDNIRNYKLTGKELYERIDLNCSEGYIGLTIESTIDIRSIPEEEVKMFELDPFIVLSKQEYSQYIRVIGVSPPGI